MSTKPKDELDNIWEDIYSAIIKKSLIVHHDKIFPLNESKKAVQPSKAGEGNIIELKSLL
jgi:hypothetical protein